MKKVLHKKYSKIKYIIVHVMLFYISVNLEFHPTHNHYDYENLLQPYARAELCSLVIVPVQNFILKSNGYIHFAWR